MWKSLDALVWFLKLEFEPTAESKKEDDPTYILSPGGIKHIEDVKDKDTLLRKRERELRTILDRLDETYRSYRMIIRKHLLI